MNEPDQRIAIAEACGWKHVCWNGGDCIPFGDNPKGNRNPRAYDHLPDYLNNLNAMHEAEKVLTQEQRDEYVELLSPTGKSRCPWSTFAVLHTTASQRAEAFLRTIGKWL